MSKKNETESKIESKPSPTQIEEANDQEDLKESSTKTSQPDGLQIVSNSGGKIVIIYR